VNDQPFDQQGPRRTAAVGGFAAAAIAGLALVLTSGGVWFVLGVVLLVAALTAEGLYWLAVTLRR
jgi:drug/metabolite transporter (DMT)-like permease